MRYMLVVLALALATPALAASESQTPISFAVKAWTQRLGGHPGLAWDKLHPAHQHLISRAHFIRCEQGVHGSEWHLRGVDYLHARTIGIHRRGIRQTRATRVWVRVRATNGGPPFSVLDWIDVVRVGSKLRWLLDKGTEVQLRAHPARCWE